MSKLLSLKLYIYIYEERRDKTGLMAMGNNCVKL